MAHDDRSPDVQLDEFSTAELAGEWEVEVVPLGKRFTLTAGEGVFAPQCNSWCGPKRAMRQARTGDAVAAVTVETVHLAGESDLGVYSVSMFRDALYGGLRLAGDGSPLLLDDDTPNFWLEGLMTIKVRLADSGEILSLVSRQPVLQVGRATSWPPYNTTMRDVSGPNEYVRLDDRDGDPVLQLWSGSITITDRPSAFLSANIDVTSFDYLKEEADGHIGGVRITWDDKRKEVPLIDHYHVFRRPFHVHSNFEWERIGGCVDASELVDLDFDGEMPMRYKVRQIFVNAFGDEIQGCGRERDFTVPGLPANRIQLARTGFLR